MRGRKKSKKQNALSVHTFGHPSIHRLHRMVVHTLWERQKMITCLILHHCTAASRPCYGAGGLFFFFFFFLFFHCSRLQKCLKSKGEYYDSKPLSAGGIEAPVYSLLMENLGKKEMASLPLLSISSDHLLPRFHAPPPRSVDHFLLQLCPKTSQTNQ